MIRSRPVRKVRMSECLIVYALGFSHILILRAQIPRQIELEAVIVYS
jgi:hypothetical protein